MISTLNSDFEALNIYIETAKPSQLLILCDENTHEHCLPVLLANLETEIPFEILEIESGEEMKTIETVVQLWQILCEFETDRKALLINLGGGVITDMGGFTASVFKRGIPFIHIPTSLLAMCDASIGGKTGVDLENLKNTVGTFAEAEQIFLYPPFLNSLPYIELRSGFAEMLKHGLVRDSEHWNTLISIEQLSAENIFPFIERSMQIKQEVVTDDFKEQNIRKILNFGHTVGHAVESLFLKYHQPIPHGEAVVLGMLCEAKLSVIIGLLNEKQFKEIETHLLRFYPVLDISKFSDEDLIRMMKNDKKNAKNEINFSLLKSIGFCEYDVKCSEEDLCSALNYYRKLKEN